MSQRQDPTLRHKESPEGSTLTLFSVFLNARSCMNALNNSRCIQMHECIQCRRCREALLKIYVEEIYPTISLSGVPELQNSRVRTQMVNSRFLLFYCILLCAPEQQEQIQAITIKSGHTPWLSNTIMMRILMRHLSKTPHHPHSSATTCHPK